MRFAESSANHCLNSFLAYVLFIFAPLNLYDKCTHISSSIFPSNKISIPIKRYKNRKTILNNNSNRYVYKIAGN